MKLASTTNNTQETYGARRTSSPKLAEGQRKLRELLTVLERYVE